MKRVFLSAAAIAAFFVSCTSTSADTAATTTGIMKPPAVRKAKLRYAILNDTHPELVIKTINGMYDIGDTLKGDDGMTYIVVDTEPTMYDAYSNEAMHRAFKDYQIEIIEDSIEVFDMGRLVGTFYWDAKNYDKEPLTTLIMDDNE